MIGIRGNARAFRSAQNISFHMSYINRRCLECTTINYVQRCLVLQLHDATSKAFFCLLAFDNSLWFQNLIYIIRLGLRYYTLQCIYFAFFCRWKKYMETLNSWTTKQKYRVFAALRLNIKVIIKTIRKAFSAISKKISDKNVLLLCSSEINTIDMHPDIPLYFKINT